MALTPVREALPDRLVDAPGILGGRSEKKSLRFKKRNSKESESKRGKVAAQGGA